ncbi:MAG TPA: hypothetical protein VHV51_08945 [Polyangiaceae bacterium]|nr:hypothetical protein [Polyangiaceae bacterium]
MNRLARESARRFGVACRAGVRSGLALCALGCAARAPAAEPPRERPGMAAARRRSVIKLPATGAESLRYEVRLDASLSTIDVEVCPRGFRIARLESPSPGAQELLGGDPIITPEAEFRCSEDGVDLPSIRADECLSYRVHLPDRARDPSALRRVDRDLLASPDLWLWVPTPRPATLAMRVHFTLPNGVVAALPWPKSGEDFALPETAFTWKAGGAFAHAPPKILPLEGGELAWTALGQGFEHEAEVEAWLGDGARAASLLFGRFPLAHAVVLGVPGARGRASFGMALRGGGPAVVILLDRFADAASLASDWTSTHEFLHLGVPRLPPEDAWLFEGLATYYTEVVRARAGAISPAAAYQHLLDGFERGRKHAGERTLREASAAMRQNHDFYRVYWSGAALAFLTDVAARRAGGPTLDAALRSFADCCAASEEDWDAERVLAKLDAELGAPRFATIAHASLNRAAFPELGAALRELGVAPGTRGEAIFQPAPDAALRDAIMAAPLQAHSDREPQEQ